MRLRPLTEAECYARCYGGRKTERVSLVRVLDHPESSAGAVGNRLRAIAERPLELSDPELEAA